MSGVGLGAAEILALHATCPCGDGAENSTEHAQHQLDALKAAGYEIAEVTSKGPDLSGKVMVRSEDCNVDGYCLDCGSATVHFRKCVHSNPVTKALKAHKFGPDGSIFAPETLQEVRDRLARIEATGCQCVESDHLNALHDLAQDDVPVLLKLIDQLVAADAAEASS